MTAAVLIAILAVVIGLFVVVMAGRASKANKPDKRESDSAPAMDSSGGSVADCGPSDGGSCDGGGGGGD